MVPRRLIRLIALLTALILLAACGSAPPVAPEIPPTEEERVEATSEPAPDGQDTVEEPEPTAEPSPTAVDRFAEDGPLDVTFSTADGVQLQGTVYGPPSDTALVLVPQYPGEQAGWLPFAQAAAEQGLRSLTFDLRGYGDSEGERDFSAAASDVEAAVTFLREEAGIEEIVLIGAAQGGTASLSVVAEGAEVAGVAVISALRSADNLEVTDADLADLTLPTLWIGARNDLLHDVEAMHDAAGSTDKSLWIYEASSLQGTYIFEGIDGPDLTNRLLDFASRVTGA